MLWGCGEQNQGSREQQRAMQVEGRIPTAPKAKSSAAEVRCCGCQIRTKKLCAMLDAEMPPRASRNGAGFLGHPNAKRPQCRNDVQCAMCVRRCDVSMRVIEISSNIVPLKH